jgi:hypothetical protein
MEVLDRVFPPQVADPSSSVVEGLLGTAAFSLEVAGNTPPMALLELGRVLYAVVESPPPKLLLEVGSSVESATNIGFESERMYRLLRRCSFLSL